MPWNACICIRMRGAKRLEIILALAASMLLVLGLASLDAFEALYEISRVHEEWELDEFLMAVPGFAFFACVVALLQLRDARREAALRLHTQHSLESALTQLNAARSLQDEFMQSVSHELRTPLHMLLNSLDLCRDEADAGTRRIYLDAALHSARRLRQLVEIHLEYASLHQEGQRQTARFSPGEVFLQEFALFEAKVKGEEAAILPELAADLPPLALGDEAAMRKAMRHLLDISLAWPLGRSVRCLLSLRQDALRLELFVPLEQWLELSAAESQRLAMSGHGVEALSLACLHRLASATAGAFERLQDEERGGGFRFSLPVTIEPAAS